jgi:hypothetical protein
MKALLAVLFLLVPTVAHADQCELVSDAVATRAVSALRGHPNVIEFCEPCGDQAPGAPHAIGHLAQRGSDGSFAVTLDQREVDLAYLYVQTAPSTYANVAALAGCPTTGVSPSLHVDAASDRGVLITATDYPVTHLPHPAEAPPPPATITYVVEPQPQPGLWTVIAACALLNGLWALAAVLLLRRRRAVAMRPRAIDMVDR